MAQIDAIVEGDIPANRLCTLDVSDADSSTAGITLQTGKPSELGPPEFNATNSYTDGENVVIDTYETDPVWTVETAGAIEAGAPVINDGTGKVKQHDPANQALALVGYSLRQAANGTNITIVPYGEINAGWLNENASGGGGFTNEKAQDAVGNAMTGTGATTVNYDDQNNTITVDSTDTDTTLSNSEVQSAAYPVAAADLAFNAATQSDLFSGNYSDLTGVSVTTGDLNFDPATQGELNSIREGVAHGTTATASGDGTKTAFTLAHSLGAAPSAVSVQATSADAAAGFYVSAKNANNVEVTFSSAPPSGTDNLAFDLVLVE